MQFLLPLGYRVVARSLWAKISFLFLLSLGLPGGDQVDGLPPAAIFAVEDGGWWFGEVLLSSCRVLRSLSQDGKFVCRMFVVWDFAAGCGRDLLAAR